MNKHLLLIVVKHYVLFWRKYITVALKHRHKWATQFITQCLPFRTVTESNIGGYNKLSILRRWSRLRMHRDFWWSTCWKADILRTEEEIERRY